MANDPGMGLREFVDELVADYGSLRKAGKNLGIDWQRLQYWKESGKKLQDFIDFLETVRKKRKIGKAAFWDRITKVKK